MYGFVLGTGRCGSTLVQELIARHGDVGFLSNVEDRFALPPFAGRFNRTIYDRVPARFTEKGRVRFAPSEGYRILDRQVGTEISLSDHDLTAQDAASRLGIRFRDFFNARAALQNKPLFLHKFTGWPRTGFIDALLPGTRYVHVVRDGRAVASSWLQMDWWIGDPQRWQWGPLPDAYALEWERSGRNPVLLAGLCWKMLIDAHDAARVPQWLEVRYEDVVAEPDKTLRLVAEHLGLDWSTELAAAVGRHPFSVGSTDKWRRELRDADLLTASLQTHLERFGYEL